MNFDEALKVLNISDYKEAIFNSNSHGELAHLMDYIDLALTLEKITPSIDFRDIFVKNVEFAEANWNRPESVYQHLLKMIGVHNNV